MDLQYRRKLILELSITMRWDTDSNISTHTGEINPAYPQLEIWRNKLIYQINCDIFFSLLLNHKYSACLSLSLSLSLTHTNKYTLSLTHKDTHTNSLTSSFIHTIALSHTTRTHSHTHIHLPIHSPTNLHSNTHTQAHTLTHTRRQTYTLTHPHKHTL